MLGVYQILDEGCVVEVLSVVACPFIVDFHDLPFATATSTFPKIYKWNAKCLKKCVRPRLHEPFFCADSEKLTSYGQKLELKKGAFSAPCKRLVDMS